VAPGRIVRPLRTNWEAKGGLLPTLLFWILVPYSPTRVLVVADLWDANTMVVLFLDGMEIFMPMSDWASRNPIPVTLYPPED